MWTRSKFIGVVVLIGLPLVVALLWILSGRETLTKSGKIVAVTVTDELFGGMNVEQRLVRGPFLGYYIGLDVVGAAVAAAVAGGLVWLWITRRRRRRGQQAGGDEYGG
jgi:hypothetical protein